MICYLVKRQNSNIANGRQVGFCGSVVGKWERGNETTTGGGKRTRRRRNVGGLGLRLATIDDFLGFPVR